MKGLGPLSKTLRLKTLHDRLHYFFGWGYMGRHGVSYLYVGIGTLTCSKIGIFCAQSRTRSDDPFEFLNAFERSDPRRLAPMLRQAASRHRNDFLRLWSGRTNASGNF